MGRWINPGAVTLAVAFLSLSSIPGCGSRATITPENHLSELEFEKARSQAALRESIVQERTASSNLKTQEDEKEQILQDLAQKDGALRSATDQVHKLAAERVELEKALTDVRESERKIKEREQKLKDIAFNSTQELTDLKSRADNATQAKEKLALEHKAIAKQLESSNHELDDLKAELTRTRAVVRSLQEHEPLPPGALSDPALQARIAELERALAEAGAVAGGPATKVAARLPAAKLDQKDLWNGLVVLTVERYEAARKGEFVWDAFEIVAMGVLGVVLAAPLFMLIVLWKGRRYRRQLAELRARATSGSDDDLDQAVDAAGLGIEASVRQGSSRNLEEAPAKAVNRRSTYMPREDRDFSAIISSPRKGKDRPELAAEEAAPRAPEPAARSVEPPAKKLAEPPARKQPEPAPRKQPEPSKAREEKIGGGGTETEREQRRAINNLFDEPQSKPKPVVEPRAHVRPKQAFGEIKPRAGSEEDSDDDMASTQIISPLRATEPLYAPERPTSKPVAKPAAKPAAEPAKSRAEPEPAAAGEDRELLDELKDIINKKFDELMKK